MDTLVVAALERFGDSAEVTLRSGRGEVLVFCHPCELGVGQTVPNLLSVMVDEARSAYLHDWPERLKAERSAERLDHLGGFAYEGCGRVIDQQAGLIEVLGFVLDLWEIPCADFVAFACSRIDI